MRVPANCDGGINCSPVTITTTGGVSPSTGLGAFGINADGAGFEIFQFVRPPVHQLEEGFDYWNTGVSHIAMTVDDLEAVIARITELGGRARSGIHELPSGTRICYCADPWGTAIELVTTSYSALVG